MTDGEHEGASAHPHLSEEHRQELEIESGIPREFIADRGYETITTKAELGRRGFGKGQQIVPALLIPLWNVNGELSGYQCKPKFPRVRKGKALKYETPTGTKMLLDVPKRVRPMLGDPKIPLYITEGVKKVDRAAAADLCCVGLLGVWNWRGTNKDDGVTALADWESITLKGRVAIIAFDSDVMTKKSVLSAMRRLRAFLESRGATVRILVLEPGPNGEKTGLDDFFVRGGTVTDLQLCIHDDLNGLDCEDGEAEYEQRDDGIYWWKPTHEGPQPVRLTNFRATFARDISRDDGVEVQRVVEVETTIGTKVQTVRVPVDGLASPDWPMRHLGINAQVLPSTTPQRLRFAIQSTSEPEEITVYAHTGWRLIDGNYYFLNASAPIGPIGTEGTVLGVETDLPEQLRACALPPPPVGDARTDAVSAMIETLEIVPLRVSAVLLLSVIRAVVGDADFSLFLEGKTGTRKTAVAAVYQAFVGAAFGARTLPANWSSTANAIEETTFTAKDIPAVVDDYVPATPGEVAELNAKADRVFRGSANRSGRQRLRSDGTPRPTRPSRCLPIATGEVLPLGHSVLARLIALELHPGDVNLGRLTQAQIDAKSGRLCLAMSAALQWMAAQLDDLRQRLKAATHDHRDALQTKGWHTRTTHTIAELLATLDILLDFFEDANVIEPTARAGVIDDITNALIEVGEAQSRLHRDADPVDLFFELLSSALASGKAHLRCAKSGDGPPKSIELQAGWVRDVNHGWSPRGQMIGWADEDGVFLVSATTESVLQQLARDRGVVMQTGTTMRKRLRELGRLASTDKRGESERLTIRKTIGKVRQEVLHLHAAHVWQPSPPSGEVSQVAQSCTNADGATTCGGTVPEPQWPTNEPPGPNTAGGAA